MELESDIFEEKSFSPHDVMVTFVFEMLCISGHYVKEK